MLYRGPHALQEAPCSTGGPMLYRRLQAPCSTGGPMLFTTISHFFALTPNNFTILRIHSEQRHTSSHSLRTISHFFEL